MLTTNLKTSNILDPSVGVCWTIIRRGSQEVTGNREVLNARFVILEIDLIKWNGDILTSRFSAKRNKVKWQSFKTSKISLEILGFSLKLMLFCILLQFLKTRLYALYEHTDDVDMNVI